jgi:hypothetical protein
MLQLLSKEIAELLSVTGALGMPGIGLSESVML